jgi:hypothetical protein
MPLPNRFSSLTLSCLLALGTVALSSCVAPTDDTEASSPDAEIVSLFVAPETVACVGVAPQECLQVRYSPDEEYQFFYSNIAGFEFEPGFNYELLVQKTPVENPPADGSTIAWTLLEVIAKTPAGE